MPTGKQVKAARVLLDWDAQDLANKTGLARETIFKMERGTANPKPETVARIVHAFMDEGIEFIDNEGVRRRPQGIEVFEGPERFNEFYDFLYEHLRVKGGDVCLSITDERLLSKYRKNPVAHYERMQELSDRDVIKSFRILAGESNFASDHPYNLYKWQPSLSLSPTAFYTFGDCLALISFVHSPAPYVVVLHSAPLAEAYRQAFDVAWDAAEAPPSKSTSEI